MRKMLGRGALGIRRTRRGSPRSLAFGCVVMAGLVAATGALGQEATKVTLQEAVRSALDRNTTTIQAANRVASSRASVLEAETQFLPDLSAGASVARAYDNHGHTSPSSMTGHVSSSLTVFDGLGNVNSLLAAQLGLKADLGSYDRARQTIMLQAASSFLSVLMNGELVQSQTENLDAERQQLTLIQEFYKAGNRSLADLLQQQAAVANAELQLLNAQQTEGVSKLQLLRMMGVEPMLSYDAVPLPVDQLNLVPESLNPDSTLQQALAHRSDVVGEKAQVDAASKQVWVARSGYLPSLSLSAGGSSSYSYGDKADNFSQQFLKDNPTYSISLSLSLPIFDKLRTRTSVRQADLSLRNERATYDDLKRQVTLEVRQALFEYDTATKRLRAAQAQLDYAKQALDATEERYRVGAGTLVELAASRAQYANARTERVQAGYNLVETWLGVGYYKGDIESMIGSLK